jgi:inhibitor of KinA
MTSARVSFPGDSCLSVAFDEIIDPAINARCVALAAALERGRTAGIRDIVPWFHTVTVHFDPLNVNRDALAADVQRAMRQSAVPAADEMTPLDIPVHYGAEYGPDLSDVAAFGDCSEADVIRLHSDAVYRVYMLGFLPGFAYLGSVDRRIAMPRLDTPRVRVAAGSVGIAGIQTGIYPVDSPGGWRIIGRAAVKTFDLTRSTPSLFKAGQRVKFIAA